ncbi:helix-turn-helix transcriptional regulator [Sneathiella glossodoripedis]|uniref:helix-turn-helix transcriptional regulator n=1 Tax=Sneathiella glossodoripedis TaxID=418853 RepID=UPI000472E57E|nr:YafY family protein [Sneathiella glossodoripedis]
MRRADRLFQIVQILQRKKNAITAQIIAEELEVSVRTIYRDIQDLIKNHVPICGEPGTGYLLQGGYDLPPMMFSDEEIEAIMLGVEWVRANGDTQIQRAAEDVLVKIGAVLPKNRQALLSSLTHIIHRPDEAKKITVSMPEVRRAIRHHLNADTTYLSLAGELTDRRLSPLIIVFFENIQLLVAWCHLRQDIRNFRMDRFQSFTVSDETFPSSYVKQLHDHMKSEAQQMQNSKSQK